MACLISPGTAIKRKNTNFIPNPNPDHNRNPKSIPLASRFTFKSSSQEKCCAGPQPPGGTVISGTVILDYSACRSDR